MGRPLRVHAPGMFYHVTTRGNHQQDLFETPNDRQYLNALVQEVVTKYGLRIHAFCWMTNHLHLLAQVSDEKLGKSMKRIETGHSRYRHGLMQTTGNLFEQHHYPRPVNADAHFKQLIRYIHLNPVAANIVDDPIKYEWSSHKAYLGLETIPWLETHYGLSQFGNEVGRARKMYNEFVRNPLAEPLDFDDMYLDTTQLDPSFFSVKVPPYRPDQTTDQSLEELAKEVCQRHSISFLSLRSSCRQRSLTPIRAEFARLAIKLGICNQADVARFLGRDPSVVIYWLSRYPEKSQTEILLT